MEGEPRGLLIVTLEDDEDVEEKKRRVTEIHGVVDVVFNHVTRKLLVRYRGDHTRVLESKIKQALEGNGDRRRVRGMQRKRR